MAVKFQNFQQIFAFFSKAFLNFFFILVDTHEDLETWPIGYIKNDMRLFSLILNCIYKE